MYVVRIKEVEGKLIIKNSKPCDNCIKLMRMFNVKRVFYTNDHGEFVCEKVKSEKFKNRLSAAFRIQNPGNFWRIKR